jgi:hypothetical protein
MAKKTNAEERRQYLRVEATGLMVLYEIVQPETLQEAAVEVYNQPPLAQEMESETDKLWHSADLGEVMHEQFALMSRSLSQLDAKLDYLIGIAEGKPAQPVVQHPVYLLDISGAGLSFLGRENLGKDVLLRLRVRFSRFPLNEVLTIGKVMWCRPSGDDKHNGEFEIGLQFEVVRDDDREMLFRFISRIERKMLRDRKEFKTDGGGK